MHLLPLPGYWELPIITCIRHIQICSVWGIWNGLIDSQSWSGQENREGELCDLQEGGRRLSVDAPRQQSRPGMALQEAGLRLRFERQLQDARGGRDEQHARRSPSDQLQPGEDPLAHARYAGFWGSCCAIAKPTCKLLLQQLGWLW